MALFSNSFTYLRAPRLIQSGPFFFNGQIRDLAYAKTAATTVCTCLHMAYLLAFTAQCHCATATACYSTSRTPPSYAQWNLQDLMLSCWNMPTCWSPTLRVVILLFIFVHGGDLFHWGGRIIRRDGCLTNRKTPHQPDLKFTFYLLGGPVGECVFGGSRGFLDKTSQNHLKTPETEHVGSKPWCPGPWSTTVA